jgi:23S rRNA (guanosine2251-2'-O)-methyltransferase
MGKRTREYVYGLNPVFEVIRGGKRRAYEALLNESSSRKPRMQKLVRLLETQKIPIQWVDKGRVLDLAGSKDHQGVVLKVNPYPYRDSADLLDEPRLLLLDNVEDPHNVGAILRCAEIFGFKSVLLSVRGVPDIYPSVVKVSAGATEFLDIAKDKSANSYVRAAQENGHQVIALDGSGKMDISSVKEHLSDRFICVIGGEDKSVGQFILNCADHVVSIQQQGRVNSLNASVAAGIALFSLSGATPPVS